MCMGYFEMKLQNFKIAYKSRQTPFERTQIRRMKSFEMNQNH